MKTVFFILLLGITFEAVADQDTLFIEGNKAETLLLIRKEKAREPNYFLISLRGPKRDSLGVYRPKTDSSKLFAAVDSVNRTKLLETYVDIRRAVSSKVDTIVLLFNIESSVPIEEPTDTVANETVITEDKFLTSEYILIVLSIILFLSFLVILLMRRKLYLLVNKEVSQSIPVELLQLLPPSKNSKAEAPNEVAHKIRCFIDDKLRSLQKDVTDLTDTNIQLLQENTRLRQEKFSENEKTNKLQQQINELSNNYESKERDLLQLKTQVEESQVKMNFLFKRFLEKYNDSLELFLVNNSDAEIDAKRRVLATYLAMGQHAVSMVKYLLKKGNEFDEANVKLLEGKTATPKGVVNKYSQLSTTAATTYFISKLMSDHQVDRLDDVLFDGSKIDNTA